MTAKTEAAVIRSQLALRINQIDDSFEVYTTIHGSGVFKWFKITRQNYEWYKRQFPDIKHAAMPCMEYDGAITDNFQPTAN